MTPAAPASAAPGMGDLADRIAAIQARLSQFTGAGQVGATARFDQALAASDPAATDRGTSDRARFTTVGAGTGTTSAVSSTTEVGGVVADADLPDGAWVERLPEHGRRWAPAIQAAAEEAGIDPALLASVVQHESNFDPDAVSHAGAIGLAQLMPGTAAGLDVDPNDPQANLRGGATYLRTQLDRFGDLDLALAAYNAGPNRVAQAGGVPRIDETQTYVARVTDTYRELA